MSAFKDLNEDFLTVCTLMLSHDPNSSYELYQILTQMMTEKYGHVNALEHLTNKPKGQKCTDEPNRTPKNSRGKSRTSKRNSRTKKSKKPRTKQETSSGFCRFPQTTQPKPRSKRKVPKEFTKDIGTGAKRPRTRKYNSSLSPTPMRHNTEITPSKRSRTKRNARYLRNLKEFTKRSKQNKSILNKTSMANRMSRRFVNNSKAHTSLLDGYEITETLSATVLRTPSPQMYRSTIKNEFCGIPVPDHSRSLCNLEDFSQENQEVVLKSSKGKRTKKD